MSQVEMYRKIIANNGSCNIGWCKKCIFNKVLCSVNSGSHLESLTKLEYCENKLHGLREKKLKRILKK